MTKIKDEPLKTPIAIINRQDGHVERIVETKKQYVAMYGQICEFEDVKMAIKVWSDFTNQTKKQLLQDFSLIELINCFSTRYMAMLVNSKRNKIEVKDESNGQIKLRINK